MFEEKSLESPALSAAGNGARAINYGPDRPPASTFFPPAEEKIQHGINILLGLVILACSILLAIIFLNPGLLQIESLVRMAGNEGALLSPAFAITILTMVMTTSIAGLCTRWVEHYAWCRMNDPTAADSMSGVPYAEMGRMTRWATSPLSRLNYVRVGKLWPLQVGAFLMLSLNGLNSFLVAGVTSKVAYDIETRNFGILNGTYDQPDYGAWVEASAMLAPDQIQDNHIRRATLNHFGKANDIAKWEIPNCTAKECNYQAWSTQIMPTCDNRTEAQDEERPVGVKSDRSGSFRTRYFDSHFDHDMTVALEGGSSNLFVNFTTFPPRNLSRTQQMLPNGTIGYIFGAWVRKQDPSVIEIVECELRFGTTSTYGNNVESLPTPFDPARFVLAKVPYTDEKHTERLGSLFLDPARNWAGKNPSMFYFSVKETDVAGDVNIRPHDDVEPIMLLLRDLQNLPTAAEMADRIKGIWATASLLAFVTRPDIAMNGMTSNIKSRVLYSYKQWFMFAPLLILACVGMMGWATRCAVGGEGVMLGYDPVLVASHGPITDGESKMPITLDDGKGELNSAIPGSALIQCRKEVRAPQDEEAPQLLDEGPNGSSRWELVRKLH